MEYTLTLMYDEIGHLFTLQEFLKDCMTGCLTDSDGWGVLSFGRWTSGIKIYPTTVAQELVLCQKDNIDFTHVVWYNK